MAKRIPIHVLDMGETGSGKDTFACTFPKPLLVWLFDPVGKETPYLKGAKKVGELQKYAIGIHSIPFRDIEREDGVVRVEYYHSEDPTNPNAYSRYLARMGVFHNEYPTWRTVVLSSVTYMEMEGRKWHQYLLNPSAKDPRQWFGGSTDLLEEMCMMRYAGLPMNLVVLAHIDEDKDELYGEIVRNPRAPGRMRKTFASAFSEHYHSYVMRKEDGTMAYALQTQNNGRFAAQTHIDAPAICYPHYESLWANWDKL